MASPANARKGHGGPASQQTKAFPPICAKLLTLSGAPVYCPRVCPLCRPSQVICLMTAHLPDYVPLDLPDVWEVCVQPNLAAHDFSTPQCVPHRVCHLHLSSATLQRAEGHDLGLAHAPRVQAPIQRRSRFQHRRHLHPVSPPPTAQATAASHTPRNRPSPPAQTRPTTSSSLPRASQSPTTSRTATSPLSPAERA
jgi:hypothetical protein